MGELSPDELIVVDPKIMAGKPVIAGTRITVEHVLEQIRFGHSVDELLEGHPRLTRAGVNAALDYALEAIRGERVLAAS